MKLNPKSKIPVLIDDDRIEEYAREYHAAGGQPVVGYIFDLYVTLREAGTISAAAPLPREVSHVA